MRDGRPLFIPVILGTVRRGRMSGWAARYVRERIERRTDLTTELVDIAVLPLPTDDAGEGMKDAGFSAMMRRADALVIVTPEYNHSFPGLLKHVLDSCLDEYIHKAAGIVGVSAGAFGGARGIQNLLPVLRELGLMTIFRDVYFADARSWWADQGVTFERPQEARVDHFLDELVWMARTLRYGREHIPLS